MIPIVSVIIPAYNAAMYIKECIDSIIRQTMENWEIILVDDGSSDSTDSICEAYAYAYPRIKFLRQDNQGVSVARNNGLKAAQGEYIMFIDSDDVLPADALKTFQTIALESGYPDMIRGEFEAIDENGNLKFKSKQRANQITKTNDVDAFYCKFIKNEYFLWLFWIKRKKIEQSGSCFTPGMVYMEDAEFLLKLMPCINKCVYTPSRTYQYRKHPHAVSASMDNRRAQNIIQLLSTIEYLIDMQRYEKYNHALRFGFNAGMETIIAYLASISDSKAIEFVEAQKIGIRPLQAFIGHNLTGILRRRRRENRLKALLSTIFNKIKSFIK